MAFTSFAAAGAGGAPKGLGSAMAEGTKLKGLATAGVPEENAGPDPKTESVLTGDDAAASASEGAGAALTTLKATGDT